MREVGVSGNMRGGWGQAARQKGGGATDFDLYSGRHGRFNVCAEMMDLSRAFNE